MSKDLRGEKKSNDDCIGMIHWQEVEKDESQKMLTDVALCMRWVTSAGILLEIYKAR